MPPDLIGRHVWVGLLGDTVTIEHSGQVVATHSYQPKAKKCSDLELWFDFAHHPELVEGQKRSVLGVT